MTGKSKKLIDPILSTQQKSINVGIGEYRVARSPHILRTVLGSCVGVMIYDEKVKAGGLAHIYLPYSHEFTNITPFSSQGNRCSYADILIPRMLADLFAMDGDRSRFRTFLSGGANLVRFDHFNDLDIGNRNLAAARAVLRHEGLQARELIIGGGYGQTAVFNLFNGGIEIKVHKSGEPKPGW